ncbi:MAG: serine--glyoxylate aminotransferase [Rhodospirillales bacterium CG15_BIG_FIL_POST_REV_8_21_14_020_66_15]|nr:MAG: serine--glyoxylate aminotransferase [Rhodospirillales bacterium CG15_BIG_FIL_POST_REV_8_21_14_020_66_15]
MTVRRGRHFLQIPGPSNTPDRILRAMDNPVMDHRGPDFAGLAHACLDGMKKVFKTETCEVVIYPASGTGAWEAALANTMSPGDRVLMYETGQFATLWKNLALRLGLVPEFIEGDWRHGVDAAAVEKRLLEDKDREIKAVCMVHNETSTGVTSRVKLVRDAIDRAGHPALFMVDTISGLASTEFRQDEWGIDVTVAGSQKGLMLPPGISFNCVSEKAQEVSKSASLPKSYWAWDEMIKMNKTGYFPYTPATNLLYGLKEAIAMLMEEGLDNVFARHERFAEATRRAVRAWGLEVLCLEPKEYSPVLTAVLMPEGHSADNFRRVTLENFDMSLGNGLNKVADKVFRIGHLGDFNELMLMGTLSGVEMGLELAKVPFEKGGVDAAMAYLVNPQSRED